MVWVRGLGFVRFLLFGADRSGLCRLEGSSRVAWWVGCGVVGFVVVLGRFRVLWGEGWGGVAVLFTDSVRREVRVL